MHNGPLQFIVYMELFIFDECITDGLKKIQAAEILFNSKVNVIHLVILEENTLTLCKLQKLDYDNSVTLLKEKFYIISFLVIFFLSCHD